MDAANLVAGEWVEGPKTFDVLDKYHLAPFALVAGADEALVERAVGSARKAFEAGLPDAYDRAGILLRVRDLVAERREAFRDTMVREAGFPSRDADGEIDRALQTLALSAEEAKRLSGQTVPFEGAPDGGKRIGFTLRVPVGLVAAITPFNAPLNTVCHKVGPAFAGGNAVVLKPSDKTPLTAELLARCFVDAGAPAGSLTVLQGGADVGQALLRDERIDYYAFTGSTAAGRAIQAAAGLRRTQMELGSIAATVVMGDADIEAAATSCVGPSFRKAGQVCTSIQMLLVEEPVYARFRDKFVERASKLRAGDPSDPATDVGPVISEDAARRIERTLQEAHGTLVLGGAREGAVIAPSVLEDMPDDAAVFRTDEIFGPAVVLRRFEGVDEAIRMVNGTIYGLATGLFTRDIGAAFKAARELRVGAVHVNQTSSSRVDLMPYGGTKASGFGHAGPAHAIREMTEERLVTFSSV